MKETATFAMGCFWCPDGLFGSIPGVLRTRVGYTGGSVESPTYRNIADHTEAIEIEFDNDQLSFVDLLEVFWENHTPTHAPYKIQYKSAIYYHSKIQYDLANSRKEKEAYRSRQKIYTEILPYSKFYLAEAYHQKYKLRRNPDLMKEFNTLYPDSLDFINSTLAARTNGFLDKYGSFENVQEELKQVNTKSPALFRIEMMLKGYNHTKGISCI